MAGGEQLLSEDEIASLLELMSHRGREIRSIWRSPVASLAAVRDRWETRPGYAGPTLVGQRGSIRVVCDATMYYVSDLRAKIDAAGVVPLSDSAADLIAAAYEAFGQRCVDYLEGDYAFCLWDGETNTLFGARDPFGSRSLFHTRSGGTLLVASTPHPLVRWQGTGAGFDPVGVLRSVLMRYGDGTSTPWTGITELPAGHSLTFADGVLDVRRYWVASGAERWRQLSSAEAVDALGELLDAACGERSNACGTSLALSGGQDSTAILASLPVAAGLPLHLLSFRFPEGDPGNEDWYVTRAAASVDLPVRWVDIADIGLYADAESRARKRSHCHGHVFEGHNRELARSAREAGDRVLLNGHGGDNLMAVGNWQMADLLRRGRLLRLRRYRAARGYRGRKHFVDQCLRPALPLGLFDRLEPLLGRRLCTRPFERPIPPWIDAEDGVMAALTRADRKEYSRTIVRNRPTITAQRRAWGLMDAGFARSCAASFDLTRDEGVELRMPFYDRRLVEFVLARPAEEFNQPNQYKVILQRAMRSRLPERGRAPQPGGLKSGTAVGVMRTRYPAETSEMISLLSSDPWVSDDIGVVSRKRFLDACGGSTVPHWWSAVDVSLPLFAEVWLRTNGAGLRA